MLYEREAIHNISAMKLYESGEIIKDLVKKCLSLGFTEILIPYPLKEEEIPVFKQIAQEVIPELRKSYS